MKSCLLYFLITMSSLAAPHFKTLDLTEAETSILSEEKEAYFSVLQAMEIAALSGKSVADTPLNLQRDELKKLFVSYLKKFTNAEEAAFKKLCADVDLKYKKILPTVAEIPWRLIKVDNQYCSGFLHTREDFIVMPEKFVALSIQAAKETPEGENYQRVCRLLLHEKLHVAQRIYPKSFRKLYRDLWGFHHVPIIHSTPEITTRMVNNPDALDLGFCIKLNEKSDQWYWPRVLFKKGITTPKMGRDFQNHLIPIEYETKRWQVTDKNFLAIEAPAYKDKFTTYAFNRGGDHPHEILAYSLEQMAGYSECPDEEKEMLKVIQTTLKSSF